MPDHIRSLDDHGEIFDGRDILAAFKAGQAAPELDPIATAAIVAQLLANLRGGSVSAKPPKRQ